MGSPTIDENNTAYNISFNWILPSGFTNVSGTTSNTFENITDNGLNYNNLKVSFSDLSSMSPGVQTMELYSEGYDLTGNFIEDASGAQNLTDEVNISFLCYGVLDGTCVSSCGYTQDPDCSAPVLDSESDTSGSSGGGSGGKRFAIIYEESNTVFELLRGDVQEFILPIENNWEGYKKDILIEVSGIKSEYISLNPSTISRIEENSYENITVTINAPSYFTRGVYDLIFSIKGDVVINNSVSPFNEKKKFTLYIVEVERSEANLLMNEAIKMIGEMNSSDMRLKEVNEFFNIMNFSYSEVNFLDVKENYILLKKIYHAAFESKKSIAELEEGFIQAELKGIKVVESKKIFFLANAAFLRGDYLLALDKFISAKMTYSLETKGKFNVYYLVKNNIQDSLFILAGLLVFSFGSSLVVKRRFLKRKLKLLGKEEKLLLQLMKVVQLETFEKNKMGMEEYEEAMNQYENKLSKTVEEKISVEAKLANMMKARGKKKSLADEKRRMVDLVKDLQDRYLNKSNIETRIYENMLKSYTEKISDIEGKLTFLEAQEALRVFRFWGKKNIGLGKNDKIKKKAKWRKFKSVKILKKVEKKRGKKNEK